jgi:phosphate uptake regulator
MSESVRKIVICQDAGDGTGDLIVELPADVQKRMGVGEGDVLNLDVIDGTLVLTPVRRGETPA